MTVFYGCYSPAKARRFMRHMYRPYMVVADAVARPIIAEIDCSEILEWTSLNHISHIIEINSWLQSGDIAVVL
jgi:hypothetical protein